MSNARTPALPAIAVLLLTNSAYAGERLNVRIIDRRDGGASYTYVVPGILPCKGDEGEGVARVARTYLTPFLQARS